MAENFAEALDLAWQSVGLDYGRGVLWYEADLVASMYFHLRRRLEALQSHVLNVDVRMPCPEFGLRRPDLVVSNDSEVLAILEAKYYPWLNVSSPQADWRLAVDQLLFYGQQRRAMLSLRIDPQSAQTSGAKAVLTEKTWLVLALVAQASPPQQESVRSEIQQVLGGRSERGGLLYGFVSGPQPVFGADLWRGIKAGAL